MSFSFSDQMQENVGFTLSYPYHIDPTKLHNTPPSPLFARQLITNSFDMLLKRAYCEPFAFYLTDEDRTHYSQQELRLIELVLQHEQAMTKRGYELVTLDLDATMVNALIEYKIKHEMTFEDAVEQILSQAIKTLTTV